MALADVIKTDYEFFDGLQSVSYYRRTAEGTFATAQTVRKGLRRNVTREEIQSLTGGKLARAGVAWTLWVDRLAGTVPKVQDVIQDGDGDRWTVLEVELGTLDTKYRCVTVKER